MIDKLEYYKHKILINKAFIDKRLSLIDKYSKMNEINREELYGILLIEHINRGKLLTKIIERCAVKFLISKAVQLDLSLGIGQIKISTARLYCRDKDNKAMAKELLKDEFNINVAAQIICDYHTKFDEQNQLLGLVKYYTMGDITHKSNRNIILYYKLLRWIIKEGLIEKN
ncbi:hypothetical protein [Lacicoccus alkaliphilus]|uniref:Transglycosylase SLT domain-containing protein n=1 Tax=Lacicoccus alkaliphilus DSM 16010 TaxID=1123231 RepID=A0A1M7G0Q0_9BACL|nr:hypothetical protein [Salinicoccus alkaliphilus]SHM09638.1 hypothetical protein SAMN02745189_01538 [Salinicoccus alkaliphilus DSM 16010]